MEAARSNLSKIHHAGGPWEDYCGSQQQIDDVNNEPPIGANIDFSIDAAALYPGGGIDDGCAVTVSGWVGPDRNNSLAIRVIPGQDQGLIPKELIVGDDTEEPPTTPDTPTSSDAIYYAASSFEKGITLPFKASVDGSVYGKDVVLSSQADVTGDVVAEKDVILEFRSSVAGDICALEDITLGSKALVGGDIHAHGDVTVGWQSTVTGDIFATGDVILDSDAQVIGSIHSGKSIIVGWNSVVKGNVYAGGAVILEGHALIMGTVYAKKTVTLGWKDTVQGDVITEGDIDLTAGDNVIEGNAIASGKIRLGRKSEIKGTLSEENPDPGVKPPSPPKECPGVKIPELSEFSAGAIDISIGRRQDEKILPGAYHILSTGGKNSLYFTRESPGECQFVFNKMILGWDLDLYLDLSQCADADGDPADMTIFSEDGIFFMGAMNIFIMTEEGKPIKMKDADPEIAKRIYWETHGDFFQGSFSDWFGTVLAENNIFFYSDNMMLIGAAASVKGTVAMGHSADVIYMPANYAVENW